MDAQGFLDDTGLATDSLDDDYDSTWVDDGTLPEGRFLDRELSWLAFNQRVLELAEDETLPLLERVNFLAIFSSNLDEFFMVRVAGLKRRIMTGLAVPTNVGTSPLDALEAISVRAHELQARHAAVFRDLVKPELDDAGIHIETWADLDDDDRNRIDEIFSNQIFPVLMPLAVDPPPLSPTSPASPSTCRSGCATRKPAKKSSHASKCPPCCPASCSCRMTSAASCASSPSKTSSPTTSKNSSPEWRSSNTTSSE